MRGSGSIPATFCMGDENFRLFSPSAFRFPVCTCARRMSRGVRLRLRGDSKQVAQTGISRTSARAGNRSRKRLGVTQGDPMDFFWSPSETSPKSGAMSLNDHSMFWARPLTRSFERPRKLADTGGITGNTVLLQRLQSWQG